MSAPETAASTPAILDSAEYRTTCAALAGLLPAPVGERLVASGEVILAGLFDGDYEAFLRQPEKRLACVHLAAALAASGRRISSARLRLAVHAAGLARRIGREAVVALSQTHLDLLVRLPDPEQGQLVGRAAELSTRGFRRAVAAARRHRAKNRGRKPLPPEVKALRGVARALEAVSPVLGELDQTARRSPQVAHELRAIATRMMDLGDEVRRRLHVPDPNPKRRR